MPVQASYLEECFHTFIYQCVQKNHSWAEGLIKRRNCKCCILLQLSDFFEYLSFTEIHVSFSEVQVDFFKDFDLCTTEP